MRRTVPMFLVTLLLAACGGGGDGGTGPTGDGAFGLQLSHGELAVEAGGIRSVGATVARSSGFEALVTLSVTGAPEGVWIEPVTIAQDLGVMVVAVPVGTAAGHYPLAVTATAGGVAPRRAQLTLVVEPPGAGGPGTDGGRVTIRVTGDEQGEWTATGGLRAETAIAPGFGSLTLFSLRAGDPAPAGANHAVALHLNGVLPGQLAPGTFDIFDRTVVEPPDEPDLWVSGAIALRRADAAGVRSYVAHAGTLRISSADADRISGQIVFDAARAPGAGDAGSVTVTVDFADVPRALLAP